MSEDILTKIRRHNPIVLKINCEGDIFNKVMASQMLIKLASHQHEMDFDLNYKGNKFIMYKQ